MAVQYLSGIPVNTSTPASPTVPISGSVAITGAVTVAEPVTVDGDLTSVGTVGTVTTVTAIATDVNVKQPALASSAYATASITTSASVVYTIDGTMVYLTITNRGANTILVGASTVSNTGGFTASIAAGVTATFSGSLCPAGGLSAIASSGTNTIYYSKGTR